MKLDIQTDDPHREDVQKLLGNHLVAMRECSPPDHVHALDVTGLLDPAVTFLGARQDGVLVGVGAIKQLGDGHAEIKSMHTSADRRGHGVGRAIVSHLLEIAHSQGCNRVSLETGSMDSFAAARSLYKKIGFIDSEPFGNYTRNPYSVYMTLELARAQEQSGQGLL